MKKENTLYLIIPCYDEEAVLTETTNKLTEKLNRMAETKLVSPKSKIVYVDDGSKDETWALIKKLHKNNKYVEGVKLSKNRGHQNALLAGLMFAKEYADVLVSMDADLQDDIEVLDDFIKEYNNGSEIVYGVRSSRKKDTFFKRNTAQLFYKIMKWLGVDIIYNHADYRLMSRRAVDELEKYTETNLFLRGIIPQIGLKTSVVNYERKARFAGKSKYPLNKMLSFAIEGILSFSVKPLRAITLFGLIISLASFVFLIYVVIGHFLNGNVAGWTTIVALISFFGGFQILCIGVIGEYIGKIYGETKRRPRYSIEEVLFKK
ncbi:glycosyltransferase family 2 protein [Candidatus Saccharibacteria bacterium]|nr:glycosyltransferase family 2 protein [Candidatus Saccharibacteria bacterium]MBQ6605756.1 glycosyltransferase family 2 protein [Candidatus Saccharibacteria bacterium]